MSEYYFSGLMPTLAERSGQAAISQLGFANLPVRYYLRELFNQSFGATGAFLADPTFEAVFGWKTADQSMAQLENSLLVSELIVAMDQAGEYAFKRDMLPYRHQLRSWEILRQQEPQSLVVTSGTGSGKTECFMVPILDHLARLRRDHGRLIGVRALFLYPLNALINNQRNRLRAWTEPFGGDIRFCLYNGNTPERPEPKRLQRKTPSEVLDRQSLRKQPPPILVTNSTMLEYMLVRTQDAPIRINLCHGLNWKRFNRGSTTLQSAILRYARIPRHEPSAVCSQKVVVLPACRECARSYMAKRTATAKSNSWKRCGGWTCFLGQSTKKEGKRFSRSGVTYFTKRFPESGLVRTRIATKSRAASCRRRHGLLARSTWNRGSIAIVAVRFMKLSVAAIVVRFIWWLVKRMAICAICSLPTCWMNLSWIKRTARRVKKTNKKKPRPHDIRARY